MSSRGMTKSTGKRSFLACLRCRQRKTKCELKRGLGHTGDSPCRTCRLSGSDCVLVQSKRGRRHRGAQADQEPAQALQRQHGRQQSPEIDCETQQDVTSSLTLRGPNQEGRGRDGSLHMELRNPSDALEILARTDRTPSDLDDEEYFSTRHLSVSMANDSLFRLDRNASNRRQVHSTTPGNRGASLNNYDLVENGVLDVAMMRELLQIYGRRYHPYCPIVSTSFLDPSNIYKAKKADNFLLTVLLTIASRDSPEHTLVHRQCWDHTQRLLLDVFLARQWTQAPRTVEGLLLLSEWLPHIQASQNIDEAPKNMFCEDRLAWSLVGFAVRQGYLLRLDRGAFRDSGGEKWPERAEHDRKLWHFIYLSDRQISVRMGQSFWSRGPSLSSNFTAADFPSLKPSPGNNGNDYSSVLQANCELIQILYNSHLILYSSTQRTRTMINEGDYARYLDDFLLATTTWYDTWKDLQVSEEVKATVAVTYEYTRLYINAFSFEAVLERSLSASRPEDTRSRSNVFKNLFNRGVMSSPDGKYVSEAVDAAISLLKRMAKLDPLQVLRYLPSRFFLYAVYAAVFLHKTLEPGAFSTQTQRDEISTIVESFVSNMEQTSTHQYHICHTYSRMLRRLWRRPGERSSDLATRPHMRLNGSRAGPRASTVFSTQKFDRDEPVPDSGFSPLDPLYSAHQMSAGDHCFDTPISSSFDFCMDSFWPGVASLGLQQDDCEDLWSQRMGWLSDLDNMG